MPAIKQKVGKQKKMQRSAREKNKKTGLRPTHIKRARARHLKNARRSCGDAFASELGEHYIANPNPGKRHS